MIGQMDGQPKMPPGFTGASLNSEHNSNSKILKMLDSKICAAKAFELSCGYSRFLCSWRVLGGILGTS